MAPFEKWKLANFPASLTKREVAVAKVAWNSCAAEAERLCFENAETGQPQCNRNCHFMDGNDIRAKLAEVDRG